MMIIVVFILAAIGALCIVGTIVFTTWCCWQAHVYRRRIVRQTSKEAANWQRFRAGEVPVLWQDGTPETEQIEAIGLFVAGKLDPIGWRESEVRRDTASLS